jgi:hypothetical protein
MTTLTKPEAELLVYYYRTMFDEWESERASPIVSPATEKQIIKFTKQFLDSKGDPYPDEEVPGLMIAHWDELLKIAGVTRQTTNDIKWRPNEDIRDFAYFSIFTHYHTGILGIRWYGIIIPMYNKLWVTMDGLGKIADTLESKSNWQVPFALKQYKNVAQRIKHINRYFSLVDLETLKNAYEFTPDECSEVDRSRNDPSKMLIADKIINHYKDSKNFKSWNASDVGDERKDTLPWEGGGPVAGGERRKSTKRIKSTKRRVTKRKKTHRVTRRKSTKRKVIKRRITKRRKNKKTRRRRR